MSGQGLPETVVNENARLELLRSEAETRDVMRKLVADGALHGWDGWSPLWEELATNSAEDFRLAARECAALGLIELHIDEHGNYAVRLLDAGYDWIKARDLVGEVEQEGA